MYLFWNFKSFKPWSRINTRVKNLILFKIDFCNWIQKWVYNFSIYYNGMPWYIKQDDFSKYILAYMFAIQCWMCYEIWFSLCLRVLLWLTRPWIFIKKNRKQPPQYYYYVPNNVIFAINIFANKHQYQNAKCIVYIK